MNIKRGLFRLWLLLSIVFCAVSLISSYKDVVGEFQKVGTVDITFPSGVVVENLPNGMDIEAFYKAAANNKVDLGVIPPPPKGFVLDNLAAGKFDLKAELAKERVPHPHPWKKLFETLLLAFGVPLAVLTFGRIAFWVRAGFN
jgi:hypothetical protein